MTTPLQKLGVHPHQLMEVQGAYPPYPGIRHEAQKPPYLGEVEPIQRVTLLLHPLHRTRLLLHPLGLLGEVEIEHRHPSGADVRLRQGVHHEHHPDGPLALPVPSDGVEEVVGIEPFAPLVRGHPVGQHQLDVVQVAFEAAVQLPGQHVLQVLPVGQHLAAGQPRDGVRVREVQLEVDAGAGVEGGLGVVRDEVPNSRVGHVDGAEEISGGITANGPEEGVELSLLRGRQRGCSVMEGHKGRRQR